MRKIEMMGVVLGVSIFSANATEQNFHSKGSERLSEPEWNQDMEKVGEFVENKIRNFLTDQKGNRVDINTKRDEEIQALAHLITAVVQEQRYDPRHYDDPVWIGLATAVPQEELWEFLNVKGRGMLIETILNKAAQTERKKYGID